jgi:hypothetical protein
LDEKSVGDPKEFQFGKVCGVQSSFSFVGKLSNFQALDHPVSGGTVT